MQALIPILLMLFVTSPTSNARIAAEVSNVDVNVVDFGAVGDGESDDTQALLKAWSNVCGASQGTPTLNIPKGKTFMLQPVLFNGPCKSPSINVKLEGKIVAPKSMNAWKWSDSVRDMWIQFANIDGLVINGGGQIDGQGAVWWNGCKENCVRPTALHIHNCKNLQFSRLTHLNSPRNHISISACDGANISNLRTTAPDESPNTDGIDISESTNVRIENSFMATGDDCIAVNSGCSFINITGITCGPGHGISIGSLGANGAHNTVEEIHVRNCSFKGTQNGVRIKTWQGGSGYARKITFEDIKFDAASNPVIIDQYYNPNPQMDVSNGVKVSDVTYRNVHGTSANEKAISINCDNTVPCTNIVIDHANITSSVPGKKTFAVCSNAHGTSTTSVPTVGL
ncbi:Pectin lyase-like superfamily protein [Quillaja saponaria]|uniref:Pectin lyase-like superfamily protein n=1 Tax=Quillaja saponaria TaxID=32244 RepID=A0AAD7QD23_QUISA|nr:Pectin lyase-like superfamily protein [Quillaja saponaria]